MIYFYLFIGYCYLCSAFSKRCNVSLMANLCLSYLIDIGKLYNIFPLMGDA
jgi:hypothetical protein